MDSLVIGVVCYPTYGGSGVVATEVGMELARRGHRVHFMSSDVPRRLDRFQENIFFHEVESATYPLFNHPHYTLALASKIVEVSQQERLDILHVHYAIPHAVSAYLAKSILGPKAPKIITTLHGTDITLVGNDPSYLPITRFSVEQSDAVTAVSQFLKEATYRELNVSVQTPIEVIYNFVDLEKFAPRRERCSYVRRLLCREFDQQREFVLCHVSTFRPVKQVEQILRAFARIHKEFSAALLMVGDGPDRSAAEALGRKLGVSKDVCFLGKQDLIAEILGGTDLFLLASKTESFGLGVLEAMACEVPVVSSRVGGVPEVMKDGESGILYPLDDEEAMAHAIRTILSDPAKKEAMGKAGRRIATERFEQKKVVSEYEALYRRILG